MPLYVMVCYDPRGLVRHACAVDASDEVAAAANAHRLFLNLGLSGYELWMGRQKVAEHFIGRRPGLIPDAPEDQQGSARPRLRYMGAQFG